MVSLVNRHYDNLEGIISCIVFVVLFFISSEALYNNTEHSLFNKSFIYIISTLVVMTILYVMWFYTTKILANYFYYFNINK